MLGLIIDLLATNDAFCVLQLFGIVAKSGI